jgi:hypothetical protein
MPDMRRRAERIARRSERARLWLVLRIVLIVVVGAVAVTLAAIALTRG